MKLWQIIGLVFAAEKGSNKMKNAILLVVTIVVMVGVSNAQSTLCRDVACECSPDIRTGPGSCDLVPNGGGACDNNGLCVNLRNDLANCGSLGHVCSPGSDCVNGACVLDDGGYGGIQPGAPPAPPLTVSLPHRVIVLK